MGYFLGGFIAGGVGVWVIQYLIARAAARGQLIRDAVEYSWKLVEKVRPKGAEQDVGFVGVYEDGDKKKFLKFFGELAEVFLRREEPTEAFWHRFSVWFLGKK